MLTHAKILVWGAYNFEKMPKTGLRNVVEDYSKSRKNQTNGDRDLKYGKKIIGRVSSDRFRRVTCLLSQKFWSGMPITSEKCQKRGSGMLRTCIQSPVNTKLMVIETSNMG